MQDFTQEQPLRLIELPHEILLHMLMSLDVKSLVNLSMASRFLSHLCNDESIWKKRLKVSYPQIAQVQISDEPNFYRNYFRQHYLYTNSTHHLNILLLGDKEVHKKELISKMCPDKIDQIVSLNGETYPTYITKIGDSTLVRIFDITGKEDTFNQIEKDFDFVDGFILVVDTSKNTTLNFIHCTTMNIKSKFDTNPAMLLALCQSKKNIKSKVQDIEYLADFYLSINYRFSQIDNKDELREALVQHVVKVKTMRASLPSNMQNESDTQISKPCLMM